MSIARAVCVRSRLGVQIGYDRLLIATGSAPVLLPFQAAICPVC